MKTIYFLGVVFLLLGGIYALYQLFDYMGRRSFGKMLKGKLKEDYERKHSDLCKGSYTICFKCSSGRVVVRTLYKSMDEIVREHVCSNCGEQLFLSASGPVMENVLKKIRKVDEAAIAQETLADCHSPKNCNI